MMDSIQCVTVQRIEWDWLGRPQIDVTNVVFHELSRKFLTTDQTEKI
jgi:hypothetical protein